MDIFEILCKLDFFVPQKVQNENHITNLLKSYIEVLL